MVGVHLYRRRHRVRRHRGRGRGVALGGLLLVILCGGGVMGVVVVPTAAARRNPPDGSMSVPVTGLEVGDCVDGLQVGPRVDHITRKPCTQPHDAEVLYRYDMMDTWQRAETVMSRVDRRCASELAIRIGRRAWTDRFAMFYFYPNSVESWHIDREVTCLVRDKHGLRLTKSVRR